MPAGKSTFLKRSKNFSVALVCSCDNADEVKRTARQRLANEELHIVAKDVLRIGECVRVGVWGVAIRRCQVAYSLTLPRMTVQTGYRVN